MRLVMYVWGVMLPVIVLTGFIAFPALAQKDAVHLHNADGSNDLGPVNWITSPQVLSGSIIIKKVTTPPGGAGFNFTTTITGAAPFSLDDGGIHTLSNVPVGNYFVTESDPAFTPGGFLLTDISCDDANSAAIATIRSAFVRLEAGETVTCTFTNTAAPTGAIVIKKVTDPQGGSGFDFTEDITPGSFTLNDGGIKTFTDIPFGNYSVTENDPAITPGGFALSSISCDDSNSAGDVGSRTATIRLEGGETVTCTFTNLPSGAVVIRKVTSPPGGAGFSFTTSITGASSFSLDDGGIHTLSNVPVGNFFVTESDPAFTPGGFLLTNISCDDANSTAIAANRSAFVRLEAGETVTCTFTNTAAPTGAIVIKKVTDPQGGSGFDFTEDITPGSFTLNDGGTKTFINVPFGAYTVAENDPAFTPGGFALSSISCNDSNSAGDLGSRTATIRLEGGETVTCVFTNRPSGSVVIRKVTSPPGGAGFSFTTSITGASSFSLDDGGIHTLSNVPVGNFFVTESDPAFTPGGFLLTDISCDDADSTVNAANRSAFVRLEAGETVTCTFINTSTVAGAIVIRKITNPPGGAGFGFTSSITGSAPFVLDDEGTRTFTNVPLGVHTFTESDPAIAPGGFTLSSVSCDDVNSSANVATRSATVHLEAGEVVTCDFINDEDSSPPNGDITPPVITLEDSAILWPPNHKYHTFALDDMVSSVVDDEDGLMSIFDLVITSASSDESENAQADGNTVNDVVISSDCTTVQVRAERQGNGNGRVYSVNIAASDSSGNIATATYRISVPKSINGQAIDDGPDHTIDGCAGP